MEFYTFDEKTVYACFPTPICFPQISTLEFYTFCPLWQLYIKTSSDEKQIYLYKCCDVERREKFASCKNDRKLQKQQCWFFFFLPKTLPSALKVYACNISLLGQISCALLFSLRPLYSWNFISQISPARKGNARKWSLPHHSFNCFSTWSILYGQVIL